MHLRAHRRLRDRGAPLVRPLQPGTLGGRDVEPRSTRWTSEQWLAGLTDALYPHDRRRAPGPWHLLVQPRDQYDWHRMLTHPIGEITRVGLFDDARQARPVAAAYAAIAAKYSAWRPAARAQARRCPDDAIPRRFDAAIVIAKPLNDRWPGCGASGRLPAVVDGQDRLVDVTRLLRGQPGDRARNLFRGGGPAGESDRWELALECISLAEQPSLRCLSPSRPDNVRCTEWASHRTCRRCASSLRSDDRQAFRSATSIQYVDGPLPFSPRGGRDEMLSPSAWLNVGQSRPARHQSDRHHAPRIRPASSA